MNHVLSNISISIFIASLILYGLAVYAFSMPLSQITMTSPRAPASAVDLSWHPPTSSWITDLGTVINGTGTYGFLFNSSSLPTGANYNYCQMPRVESEAYKVPSKSYQLVYVELVHRHHKRTPYAANSFPKESYSWNCNDEGLFTYGEPLSTTGERAAATYWSIFKSPSNPFPVPGFGGSCTYPQITHGGLEDSRQHGKDLFGVYHDKLGFLPDQLDDRVVFRVTNNVITSQVASMLIAGMYPTLADKKVQLKIQPASIDSLEPKYNCLAASELYSSYASGSSDPAWTAHLDASKSLYSILDSISGVASNDSGFHMSWDHYFDNLSSRQCHKKPLPCSIENSTSCVTQAMADEVYRLGQYEYSYTYRASSDSLRAAVGSYGVWIAELSQNIRDAIGGKSNVIYRHNIAHDGSVSRLLSILQVDMMIWPGMGAEVVFEIYKVNGSSGRHSVRILWGGQVLRSSNPSLGALDMIDLNILLAYLDGLVGANASKVVQFCCN